MIVSSITQSKDPGSSGYQNRPGRDMLALSCFHLGDIGNAMPRWEGA